MRDPAAKTRPQMVGPSWLERDPGDLGRLPAGGQAGAGQAGHPGARAQNLRSLLLPFLPSFRNDSSPRVCAHAISK